MSRELLLLRHGKSDWSGECADFDRPLQKRGKLAAQRMGVHLQQSNLVPDYIVSSPAERAANTAVKLAKVLGLGTTAVYFNNCLYEAALDQFIAVLSDCPASAQRVLLVGHNPGLEILLDFLSQTPIPLPEDGKLLPTAALAHLSIAQEWRSLMPRTAYLLSITRAKSLPETFPFHGPQGLEQRIRPAYYYAQSAALTFRIRSDTLEYLLITSSGKRHWNIPKGIIEPGLTPYESAAVEAREEAGVLGNINAEAIGSYDYPKWEATCNVQVFPMQVTEMLNDSEWEENHRRRQWFKVDQALDMIKHKPLRALMRQWADKLNSDATLWAQY